MSLSKVGFVEDRFHFLFHANTLLIIFPQILTKEDITYHNKSKLCLLFKHFEKVFTCSAEKFHFNNFPVYAVSAFIVCEFEQVKSIVVLLYIVDCGCSRRSGNPAELDYTNQ